MFNPFEKFEERLIDAFIKTKEYYLVAQSYKAGYDIFDGENKEVIMFTQYADPGLAEIHRAAVEHDRFAAILDLRKEKHLEKLRSMLQPGSKYVVYTSMVRLMKDLEKRIEDRYLPNIRRYITNNTNWRIGGNEEVRTQYEVTFGEFFIILKYNSRQPIRIKFEEIEKA